MSVPAGWYNDPSSPNQLRWWSGDAWTEHVTLPQPPVTPQPAPLTNDDMPTAPISMDPFAAFDDVPAVAVQTGAVATGAAQAGTAQTGAAQTWQLGYGPSTPASPKPTTAAAPSPRGLRKRLATPVLVGAAALLLIAGVASAVTGGNHQASLTTEERPIALVAEAPSPRPTPTTVTTQKLVDEEEIIGFAATQVDDPSSDAGTSAVTVVGVNGVKTKSYRVTYENGTETSRTLISEAITRAPVDQVTAIGSYVAPAPVVQAAPVTLVPQAGGECDPNYSGCVPIDTDVDCAGGSGNGPSYADGPVEVIGTDIYDLDSNGDGFACEG